MSSRQWRHSRMRYFLPAHQNVGVCVKLQALHRRNSSIRSCLRLQADLLFMVAPCCGAPQAHFFFMSWDAPHLSFNSIEWTLHFQVVSLCPICKYPQCYFPLEFPKAPLKTTCQACNTDPVRLTKGTWWPPLPAYISDI